MMLDDANGNIRNAAASQLRKDPSHERSAAGAAGSLERGKPPGRSLAAGTLGMLGREAAAEAVPAAHPGRFATKTRRRKGAVTSLLEPGEAAAPAAA